MSMFGRKADNDLRTNDPRIIQKTPVEQAHALGNLIDDLEQQVSLLMAENAALNVDIKLISGQRDQMIRERNHFAERAAYWQDLFSRIEERVNMAGNMLIGIKKSTQPDMYAPKDEVHKGLETLVEDLPKAIEPSTEDQPQTKTIEVTHRAPPKELHNKALRKWYYRNAVAGCPDNWQEHPVVELKESSPYRRAVSGRNDTLTADIAGLAAVDMELQAELSRGMNGQHGESGDSDADYGDSLAGLGEHPEHKG